MRNTVIIIYFHCMEKSSMDILHNTSFSISQKSSRASKEMRVRGWLLVLNSTVEAWAAHSIWSWIMNSHTWTLWLWIDLPLFDLWKANWWPKYIYKIVAEKAVLLPKESRSSEDSLFCSDFDARNRGRRERARNDWINVCNASPEQTTPDQP